MSSFGKIYDIAATGLFPPSGCGVQLIASNIANAETTRTPEGGPFRKKDAIFELASLGSLPDGTPLSGVKVNRSAPARRPSHPLRAGPPGRRRGWPGPLP